MAEDDDGTALQVVAGQSCKHIKLKIQGLPFCNLISIWSLMMSHVFFDIFCEVQSRMLRTR